MAASGVQLNWSNVQWGTTPITRVTSVTFDQGGELIDFAGDNNRYPVMVANPMNRPRATVTSADIATLFSFTVGTSATLTATQLDAAAASGGNIVWTFVNCVHGNSTDNGSFGQFASGSAQFQGYSPDGATSPLTLTRS